MKIEPPADDLGLQKLKAADRARGKVEQVDHTEPSARIAPSQERHETLPPGQEQRERKQRETLPPEQERRGQERRSGHDRRQQPQPHLLDTREPHERRTRQRRESDRSPPTEEAQDENPTPTGGIDVRA